MILGAGRLKKMNIKIIWGKIISKKLKGLKGNTN